MNVSTTSGDSLLEVCYDETQHKIDKIEKKKRMRELFN